VIVYVPATDETRV